MKTYVLIPKNERMHSQIRAVWVVNEFRHKGYNTQKQFLNIVHLCLPELNNEKDTKNLRLFWMFRSLKFLDELENLIKKL
ncbi:hypothetical protein SAMN05421741_11857 [Paenimyroides ummariense]|uniref:Uncharacterized protein n=1 Tax=Paenimyroides ummariense TaxID=913024 RepID=A0A1I5E2J9_9FLAO|nr:hypothetical protein [Paenimyroides ummariense]SFO05573.1 hypothetical protein SAMN05421741_11857 [Paenimyroides ummariense]